MFKSLPYRDETKILRNCGIQTIDLPTSEKAENLGHELWLITSATTDYTLDEYSPGTGLRTPAKVDNSSCLSYLTFLECGHSISTTSLKIQSALSSCRNSEPLKINIQLSDPLQRIFSKIPSINKLPHFATITTANHEILKGVQSRLRKMPGTRKDLDKLEEITESTSVEFKSFKPLFDASFLLSPPLRIVFC